MTSVAHAGRNAAGDDARPDEASIDIAQPAGAVGKNWCRRRDLNPRPPAYEADALPLSYAGRNRATDIGAGRAWQAIRLRRGLAFVFPHPGRGGKERSATGTACESAARPRRRRGWRPGAP